MCNASTTTTTTTAPPSAAPSVTPSTRLDVSKPQEVIDINREKKGATSTAAATTTATGEAPPTTTTSTTTSTSTSTVNAMIHWISSFSLNPWLVLSLIPLCPTWFFLNRGYTQWFHWTFVFYFLTEKTDFKRRFLLIQGLGVCLGWYACVVHDYIIHQRPFCNIMYMQMPLSFRDKIYTAPAVIDWDNYQDAMFYVMGSHIIDLIAHPGFTYVAWWLHSSQGGSLRDLAQWDVIWSTFAFSRFYSLVHSYYNDGSYFVFWYYGYDVYNIERLESYTIAYIFEAATNVLFAIWMVYDYYYKHENKSIISNNTKLSSKTTTNDSELSKPNLIQSESCLSATTTST